MKIIFLLFILSSCVHVGSTFNYSACPQDYALAKWYIEHQELYWATARFESACQQATRNCCQMMKSDKVFLQWLEQSHQMKKLQAACD